MKINGPIIKEIISLQNKEKIFNNKLLLFGLALEKGNATLIKVLKEDLNISQEEIISYLKLFEEKEWSTKKDLDLIKKMEKIKIIDIENFQHEIEEVIAHLNAITNSRKKVTESRKKIVQQWLRKGYTLEQFKMVNLFFNHLWEKDPQMSQYIRPETLYNTKFPIRVEEAENAFIDIKKYKKEIKEICEYYDYIFDQIINKNKNLEFSQLGQINMCSYIPFDIQKRITFWLKKEISIKDILFTIKKTIDNWSKKEELIPYISLLKILDAKFLDRLKIAKSIEVKKQKTGTNALENWLNTDTKENN